MADEIVWISAAEALALVRVGRTRRSAIEAICRRAHAGLLAAHADRSRKVIAGREPEVVKNRDLSPDFWWHKGGSRLHGDWSVGDFSTSPNGMLVWEVFGVRFDRAALQPLIAPSSDKPSITQDVPQQKRGGGRTAAKWWPKFAEELAVYFEAAEYPDGVGSEGSDVVIEAIFKRMQAKGDGEPGRTTVQPVVSAILKRVRSA